MINALFCLLLFLPGFVSFAQESGDALRNYRTGRDLESRNRLTEAEVYYARAVQICNDEISRNVAGRDTYAALTWALQRQRKYSDVIVWGERGLRLFEDEYRIVETMGEAYFYLDDYERSLRFMQRYTNSAPRGERTGVAYFFIGEIYRYRKQFYHADIAYTTAVKLEGNIALWWFRLGSVREAAGDLSPAVESYEQSLRLNPDYREARDGLVRCQRRPGE